MLGGMLLARRSYRMKKLWHDLRIIVVAFMLWGILLWGIQGSAPTLWPLRERFMGILTPWANFDGIHYVSIARWGYRAYQQAFFPVYPVIVRFVSMVIHIPHEFAAILSSRVAFLIGLLVYWRYLGRTRGRTWTIIFFLLYPASFFFAAGYSESVFFALASVALLALKRKRWILAGSLVGVASATRLIGVFLIFPLMIAIKRKGQPLQMEQLVAVMLAPLGLLVYMAYLWGSVGDSLAFFHVQPAFGAGRSGSELILLHQVFWRYVRILTTVPPGHFEYHVAILELSSFVFGMVLLIAAWRKRYDLGVLLYCGFVLFLPTLTGTLSSMPRYLLGAFPLFSVLGQMSHTWRKVASLIVFLIILVYAATGFLRGFFIS